MSKIERLRLPEDDATFGSNRIFDLFQYSPAVTANGLVFIAGQIGVRADGSIPEEPKEQIDVAFKRIEAVLKHMGLDFTGCRRARFLPRRCRLATRARSAK